MARLHQCFLLVLLAHSDVIAAPRDVTLEDIAKVSPADPKASDPITLEDATPDDAVHQGDRQKRFYDYNGYGFPPMSPVIYPQPHYPNPNDPYAHNFAADPFLQIFRRLQEISSAVNSPHYNANRPPPPPPFPVLFPVIFIPQVGCNCRPRPPTPARNGTNSDDVGISNRFPEMEDERQNWGIVVNQNETEAEDGMPEDFTRPISFVPIGASRPPRPPPAVEHGSDQAGAGGVTTTTPAPAPPARPAPPPPAPVPAPSPCDAAVLSCCHQPQVTYDCFAALGCPDPTSYGNPCDAQVVLAVIDRYQRFYGQKAG